MTPEGIPLHNLEAEMSALGSMILRQSAIDAVQAIVTEEDFYLPAHREMFIAIMALANRNRPVEILTVKNELLERGKLAEIGGEDYVIQVAEAVPSAVNAAHYAQIVSDKATLRQLLAASDEIAATVGNPDLLTEEKVERAEQLVYAIGNKRGDMDWVESGDIARDLMADMDNLIETGDSNLGLQSGFYDLDAITTGFYDTDLIIIGARPSMGKTALALKIAVNVSRKTEKRVALFSLEMGHKQLGRRMVSMLSGISSKALKRHDVSSDTYRMIADGCEIMYAMKLSINEQGSLPVNRMRAKLRRLKREKGLALVVVDYLQLMAGSERRNGNRTQEVDEIAKGLKQIAMELEVPVIALAQLNREVERRENKRPMLADLRESGDIEAAADLVMFLYRDDYYKARENPEEANTDPNRWEVAELIIAKHRNGEICTVKLGFHPSTTNFENIRT